MKEYTIEGFREYAEKLSESGQAVFVLLLAGNNGRNVGVCNGPAVEIASELALACHKIAGFDKVLEGALDAYRNVSYSEE